MSTPSRPLTRHKSNKASGNMPTSDQAKVGQRTNMHTNSTMNHVSEKRDGTTMSQGTDLFSGNGFGSPYEDSESIHAHHNGHRKQNGSNDLHCVIRTLQVRPDSTSAHSWHADWTAGKHARVTQGLKNATSACQSQNFSSKRHNGAEHAAQSISAEWLARTHPHASSNEADAWS